MSVFNLGTAEDEFFVKSLIRGPLARPAYVNSLGQWVYAGDWGATSGRSRYNTYRGYPGAGYEETLGWPDPYINIQYPEYIWDTGGNDVEPAPGTDTAPIEGVYRQLLPEEDGGQWFCPDVRVLLHAGKCVKGYEVGGYSANLEDFPVIGGPNAEGYPPPDDWASYGFSEYDWPQNRWPAQVHWPPVDLKIDWTRRIYDSLCFDPPPDFMQVYVSFSGGRFGSYNASCAIGMSGMTGIQDYMLGKPVGCGDSVLFHPQIDHWVDCTLPLDLEDRYGILMQTGVEDGPKELTLELLNGDGTFRAFSLDYPPGESGGSTSYGTTIPGATVHPALQYAKNVLISASGFFSTDVTYPNGLHGLGGYLVRAPGGTQVSPVWEGEPDNVYKKTLWRPHEVLRVLSELGSDKFGYLDGGGMSVSCAFYWLPPDTTYAPSINVGERQHHLRQVRRRVGGSR